MQHLDIRTIFITVTSIYLIMTICLYALWFLHRNLFKGIGIFATSMASITAGYFGLATQGLFHPFFSIVISNTLIILSVSLIIKSLNCFIYGSCRHSSYLYIFPVLTCAEQIVFTYIYPDLLVRIIFISLIYSIICVINILIIAKSNKRKTLPGIILICSFMIITISFIIRIPITIKTLASDALLSSGIIQAVLILLVVIPTVTITMGFVLLVSQELQSIDQKRAIEKDHLLKEVHHRIKNNMQTMESILVLQAEAAAEPTVKHALNDAAERLTSMMILYNKLYRGEDLENISASSFLSSLVDEVIAYFPINVAVTKDFDDVLLPITKASFTGIILNELITNSMKYAFHGRNMNNISVSLKNNSNHVTITFHDNGIGFNTTRTTEGFGLNLCKILVHQMEGTFNIENDRGTKCTIEFDL